MGIVSRKGVMKQWQLPIRSLDVYSLCWFVTSTTDEQAILDQIEQQLRSQLNMQLASAQQLILTAFAPLVPEIEYQTIGANETPVLPTVLTADVEDP